MPKSDPKILSAEYYRLWEDGTWDTEYIDIPADTKDEDLDSAVRTACAKIDWRNEEPPVIVGYYCRDEDDEDDDAEEDEET